jgi:hypothetical protein
MAKMTEEARATVILNGQQANATLKEFFIENLIQR